ncbi:MAG: TIM44-like domain-containing protein [Stellaceae bacterium]
MAKWLAAAILALATVLAMPQPAAEARAGGHYSFNGGSFLSQGSRGSHSFGSRTPQSTAPRYSYGTYHQFWTGLAGGLFGSWIGRLLFPHWGYGFGFGHMIGGIVSLLALIWLVRLAVRAFVGGGSVLTGGSTMGFGRGLGVGSPSPPASTPLAINGADYKEFENVLREVQNAWNNGDIDAMRPITTPEMLRYFADTLAENRRRGVANHVEQVELLRGDLREAWDEGRMHYATCYLRWRAIDYTVRLDRQPGDHDQVVDGDPRQPVEATELWTFARPPGGRWVLSAIEQV